MHPELPTFVTEAKKKTFHVTVKSHGAISEAKVQELIVSGYGPICCIYLWDATNP